MKIYPGIDILNGKCVRMKKDPDQFEDYGDPLEWALKWEGLGAPCVHIVDLNAAIEGENTNYELIKRIVKELKIPVQFGGGIRDRASIERSFDEIGVSRLIIGTMAVEEKDEVARARSLYGDRIIVSIDAKDGKVTKRGRTDVSDLKASDFALEMHNIGIDTIIYTDVLRDGTFEGPNFERTEEIIKRTWMNVVVSGGIHTIDDIVAIRGTGACGAVIGRALYENTIDYKEALLVK